METDKNNKLIRLDNDILKHIESNSFINSFSDWVEQKYKQEFLHEQFLKEKIIELQEQINFCKKCLEVNNLTNELPINENEKRLIINDLLKRENPYKEGVYLFFINTFNRRDLSIKQFHLILDKLRGL